VIKPSWEEYRPLAGDLVIEMDPGMAFGCGTHATTALCLTLLEKYVRPGITVYDIGTGSGILAVAAARLGAGRVRAVDIDRWPVR
jgi:ribosomal protein L11 methyltransferase